MDAQQIASDIVLKAERELGIDLNTCLKEGPCSDTARLDTLASALENRIGERFDTLLPPCSLPNTSTWCCRGQVVNQVTDLVNAQLCAK